MKKRDKAADQSLGRRIRTLRVNRRLTQHELAGRLDLTYQNVQKYEKGASGAWASIPALCRALETDPNTLFGWEEDETNSPMMSISVMRIASQLDLLPKQIITAIGFVVGVFDRALKTAANGKSGKRPRGKEPP